MVGRICGSGGSYSQLGLMKARICRCMRRAFDRAMAIAWAPWQLPTTETKFEKVTDDGWKDSPF